MVNRVRSIPVDESTFSEFDINIYIDCNKLNNEDFQLITILPNIIQDMGTEDLTGMYELGNIQVYINRVENKLNTLVHNTRITL
jgi:hypothetical protein